MGLSVALFPMVIMAMTIERMSVAWDERGAGTAIREGVGTLVVAALAYLVMSWAPLEHLVFVFPELLLVLFALSRCCWVATRATACSELLRFRALARERRSDRAAAAGRRTGTADSRPRPEPWAGSIPSPSPSACARSA